MPDLSELSTATSFALDSRSIAQRLQDFYDYVRLIPVATEPGENWSALFFPGAAEDLQRLAGLYQESVPSDGNLPPLQAFLLAFLRLQETPRGLLNRLPGLHQQLYYRDLLGLQPRDAKADQVVLSFNLAAGTTEQILPAQTLLDAGQDSQGQILQYAVDQPLQVNPGQLHALRWVRRAVDAGIQHSLVLHDVAGPFLPASGVRLFEPHPDEQIVRTGRVIAADVLALAGGVREITVLFDAAPEPGELELAFSGVRGWHAQSRVQMNGMANHVHIIVAADQAAITAADGLDGFHDVAPLLKITRQDGHSLPPVGYLMVEVTATDTGHIASRTDQGMCDWRAPLTPFGAAPQEGATIELIAADWLQRQAVTSIILIPEWEGLPEESFLHWYAGYPSQAGITGNEVFQITAHAWGAQGWQALGPPQALFASGTGTPVGVPLTLSGSSLRGEAIDSVNPNDWSSRIRLQLSTQDFLHQEYWQQMERHPAFDRHGQPRLHPPYTPRWKSLSIRYRIEQLITPQQQYLLTPFGHQSATAGAEAVASAGGEAVEATEPDQRAELYLGLSGMQAGQQLSLYWKLQSPQPQQLQWQYLNRDNQWRSLQAMLLDHTGGWFDSGLWRAWLPSDASEQAPWMPAGCHWLRARVSDPPEALRGSNLSHFPLLQGLLANSVTATLANPATIAADHFERPLSANSIGQSVSALSGLESVLQGWPLQGGRAKETQADFNRRVQRQLSCRGRAVRQHDLESLLLDQFPELFGAIIAIGSDLPGRQTITVIPAPGQLDNTDTQRPAFSPARLGRMRQYLEQRSSMWVELELNNPIYVDVTVCYQVQFDAAISHEFGSAQLERALNLHYLPWVTDNGASLNLGKQLDYYQLLAFIQQQPFVSKVIELLLNAEMYSIMAAANEVLIPQWKHCVV